MDYPESKQVNQVDNFFGTPVPDPYRWLEDDVRNSDSVREWVDSQNALTFSIIGQLPYRNEIKARLTKLWDYEKFGTPFKRGERYFYFKNNGLQNQSVLYKLKSLGDEPTVLIDPNQWSADGTNALGGLEFSDDGKLLAYGVQKAGSDWRTWKVMNVETGEQLSDELNWIKFGSVSWTKDSAGFFYSCYDEPKSDQKFQGLNLGQKVYYHRIGDLQSKDQLVHENPDNPKFGFLPEVSEDGKYLVITVWQGTDDRYRVLYQNLDDPNSKLTALIENFENEYSFLGNDESRFYFKSDFNAPKKCILSIDTLHPEQANWKVIVPESDDSMESAGIVGNNFIVQYLQDAKSLVKLYKLDGKYAREVKLPGIGTASGFGGRRDQKETFYSFSSFNRPPSVYRYDLKTGVSTLIREAKVDFNPNDFVVKQVFYKSKDGTQVPMFIAHKKGLELNGKNPTLLYAYGGFNISLTPSFSISRLQWMEMGGIFAMPNLRGGGEYGKAWHKAGTKTNKQNVFDDFIAAAEYLIAKGYTSADHLGIQGGSNGGLLVGACLAQRPDLYGACLPAVGVMDMLRFHKFTAGRFWVDDYGSSEASAEEFNALFAYSPYHNLVDGEEYPPTMVTTADTDDRVVPGHSFKFAARLQAAQAGSNPVLIRIETKAGHGAGKPTAKIIEEYADQWAFLAKHLGLTPQFPSK
ncbi:prolyl oligopeptidase family serine peptidase [Mariniblastus sp.]|nr:prolyl oligopeptidase family serine peptidase [Mariniblastus sp.]MDA7924299.1 prolyl oligopeptidase family serine peptidase [Mariniblastus sp.]